MLVVRHRGKALTKEELAIYRRKTPEQLKSLAVLREALDEGDTETVALCLKAGQSLNAIVPSGIIQSPNDRTDYEYPLLIKEIDEGNKTAVFTMLQFKEVLNLDILHNPGMTQSTPLASAVCELWIDVVEALLLAGASTEHPEASFKEYHHPFALSISYCTRKSHDVHSKAKQKEMAVYLLSCGVEPWFYPSGDVYTDYSMVVELAEVAKRWLSSLECAQTQFKNIFDDANLETLLAELMYHKKYLEQLIREHKPVVEMLREKEEWNRKNQKNTSTDSDTDSSIDSDTDSL